MPWHPVPIPSTLLLNSTRAALTPGDALHGSSFSSHLCSAPKEGTEGSGQEFPLLHLRVKNFLSEVEKKKTGLCAAFIHEPGILFNVPCHAGSKIQSST